MHSIFILIALAIVAILAITSTVTVARRDGYRRTPPGRPVREYERTEPYRAWTGRP